MSRFRQTKDPSGDPRLAALYAEILDHGFGEGAPINWFTAQSERPDILSATWALTKGIVLGGQLPPMIKQMIIVLISTRNRCEYCKVTHKKALQALAVPNELIDSVTTRIDLSKMPPQHRAILEFADRSSRDPLSLTDEDFQQLADFGLSEGEIIEVIMTAAFTTLINTWSEVSGIEIDEA